MKKPYAREKRKRSHVQQQPAVVCRKSAETRRDRLFARPYHTTACIHTHNPLLRKHSNTHGERFSSTLTVKFFFMLIRSRNVERWITRTREANDGRTVGFVHGRDRSFTASNVIVVPSTSAVITRRVLSYAGEKRVTLWLRCRLSLGKRVFLSSRSAYCYVRFVEFARFRETRVNDFQHV